MDSVLIVIQSPAFLGALLFLGLASLVRVVLSRDPSMKRNYDDRRQVKQKAVFPLVDSDGETVSAERRVLADRRRQGMLVQHKDMERDGLPS